MGSYYGPLLTTLCRKFIRGAFSQSFLLWLFLDNWHLPALVHFLQQTNIVRLQALLDIAVTDNPEAVDGRFGLLYSFWCYHRGARIFLKTFANATTPMPTLTALFPSAGWLEREA